LLIWRTVQYSRVQGEHRDEAAPRELLFVAQDAIRRPACMSVRTRPSFEDSHEAGGFAVLHAPLPLCPSVPLSLCHLMPLSLGSYVRP
jgi:hypothetical protein